MTHLKIAIQACIICKYFTGIDYEINYRSRDQRIIIDLNDRFRTQYTNITEKEATKLRAFIKNWINTFCNEEKKEATDKGRIKTRIDEKDNGSFQDSKEAYPGTIEVTQCTGGSVISIMIGKEN